MRPQHLCLLVVLLFSAGVLFGQGNSVTLQQKVSGFSHPESVVLDEEKNVLYVSNMADDSSGDGFISRVSREGEILDLKWISGLEDPKGLLVKESTLYVANNTEVVQMDIEKAEIERRIPVEGSKMLNDITMDEEGIIYISDSGKSSIYRMDASGEIEEWMNSENLEYPNGLLAVGDKIFVAAWGKEEPGNLLRVDKGTKKIERLTTEGIGNLDGIQQTGRDSFYISDWATGKIYEMGTQGEKNELLTAEKSSGDILYLEEEKKLILPMNFQNEVWWYQVD